MKLIDWATVPQLTNIVIFGAEQAQHLCYSPTTATVFALAAQSTALLPFRNKNRANCRIDFSKSQPWLAYEEGVTIVPEWAEVELKVKDYKQKFLGYPQIDPDLYTESFADRVIDSNVAYLTGQAYAYRITDIKAGWTDEPSEVTK